MQLESQCPQETLCSWLRKGDSSRYLRGCSIPKTNIFLSWILGIYSVVFRQYKKDLWGELGPCSHLTAQENLCQAQPAVCAELEARNGRCLKFYFFFLKVCVVGARTVVVKHFNQKQLFDSLQAQLEDPSCCFPFGMNTSTCLRPHTQRDWLQGSFFVSPIYPPPQEQKFFYLMAL